MKLAVVLAGAICAVTSIPLLAQANADISAQQNTSAHAAGTQASESASTGANTQSPSSDAMGKATYTAAHAGWGDDAASHAWEMSSISGDLEGKLDAKTAKVGDRVVLKTIDKVQTSDGTVIPRGSKLLGHVTAVQAYDKEHAASQMGIAFDRVEMKNGQSVGIYTLIRGAIPGADPAASSGMGMSSATDAAMSMGDVSEGGHMGGGRSSGGLLGGAGSAVGGAGSAVNGATDMSGGLADRTIGNTSATAENAGAGLATATNSAVQTAGHGDLAATSDVHTAAAARMTPHPTGIPGVMLAGNSVASGAFSTSKKNIVFESGTQLQLGIVANR